MVESMVRVLVADDSPLFVDAMLEILGGDRHIDVVAVAADGAQAVELCLRQRPDVVVLDVQMPVMDGLEAIEYIMADQPTPILVMTGDARGRSGELSFEALRRGALDLVLKPDQWPLPEADRVRLRARVKDLASVPVVRHQRVVSRRGGAVRPPPITVGRLAPAVVGVVSSTGGPAALAELFESLPADFAAGIVVVQHISPGFVSSLVRWLDSVTPLDVRIASAGDRAEAGLVLIAPDGAHLEIDARGMARLVRGGQDNGHCPSGDRLLSSLADGLGSRAAGVILSGMGDDGVEGLGRLRGAGGRTLAQDEASSAVYGMPREAWLRGAAEQIVSMDRMAAALVELVSR